MDLLPTFPATLSAYQFKQVETGSKPAQNRLRSWRPFWLFDLWLKPQGWYHVIESNLGIPLPTLGAILSPWAYSWPPETRCFVNVARKNPGKVQFLRVLGRWWPRFKAHSILPGWGLQLYVPSLLKLNCCGGCSSEGIFEPMLDCGPPGRYISLCIRTLTGAAIFQPAFCATCLSWSTRLKLNNWRRIKSINRRKSPPSVSVARYSIDSSHRRKLQMSRVPLALQRMQT